MAFSDFLNERFDNYASILELKRTISDLEECNSELADELYGVITFFEAAIKYARTNVELHTRIKEYYAAYYELEAVDIERIFDLLFAKQYTQLIDCDFFNIDEASETVTDELNDTVKYFPFKLAMKQLDFEAVDRTMVCDWVYDIIVSDPPELLSRIIDGYDAATANAIKELKKQAAALGFTLTKA